MTYDPERAERNDKSRNEAEHHREEWTADENDFLRAFMPDALAADYHGDPTELDEVARCLGRTREACRQRYYILKNPKTRTVSRKTTTTTTTTTEYIGLYDDPEDRWWDTTNL